MSKAVNDATLKKAGDLFQYYIALRNCFNMKSGDKLQIEVNGDVSLISSISGFSFQIEVKHHFGEHFLSDRNIDFWKTLSNWYVEYDRISIFSSLVLYTTSTIGLESPFYDWNNKKQDEKLSLLLNIGNVEKKDENTFRKYYNKIFDKEVYDKDKLEDILSRFTIEYKQNKILDISKEFDCYVGHIPKDNRDNYIGALLGRILSVVKEPPHIWELSREEFDEILQQESVAYSNSGEKPLPTIFNDEDISEYEKETLVNKNFVEEIKKIEYDDEIQLAILDYWKTSMTIINFFNEDFLYNQSLEKYRDDLSYKLKHQKKISVIKSRRKSREEQIENSQILYSEVMSWDVRDFESIIKNQYYFQRGIIHTIVDVKEFSWDVGENN
ncbi:hypothetical protein C672_1601 [[Clostridium] bifermentans ATCC 638]|uniref:Uncharacterized protein n=1 Tax=Paraclostridium bifermentans ATCC 638 = DSM 14991 TaxID=1233171 RepID=T4VPR4_PARBF|nr:hypothetical protein [Paraclostridium bifermentans]EQK42657.1 hypothetical protein C672_1601 [[Clostridium] bifermentans ATCC 638] [Paraclostridium bifermentans ATCC 638 = DSM 14991]RIZ60158.1 hypothetical protein CHH45_04370 [Paraclostridium bifermentans]UAG19461.1 hypothetical protein KXZ80_07080 [Paraclostridium bifermentans]